MYNILIFNCIKHINIQNNIKSNIKINLIPKLIHFSIN